MATALAGIRVLDLANVLAGPFCAYQLASARRGESSRSRCPGMAISRASSAPTRRSTRRLMGASFLAQNSGKKSVTVNLEVGRRKGSRCNGSSSTAHVLVENFRPGVMDRLGVGYEQLRQHNPSLVYCAISGFGQDGPMKDAPAYDQIVQGLSGAMSITGDERCAPLRVGYPVADTLGGITAAFAIAERVDAAHADRRGSVHRRLDARLGAREHGLGHLQLPHRGPEARADGQRQLHRRAFGRLQDRRAVSSTSRRTSRSSSRRSRK